LHFVTISIANNVDLSMVRILFIGSKDAEYGENGQMGIRNYFSF